MPAFSNPAVIINDNGIDLLRNRFAYRHLDFPEILEFRIEDGHLLKNRWIIFAAGIGLYAGAIKLVMPILQIGESIISEGTHANLRGLSEILGLPFLLFLFGVYCIYQSQIKSKILVVETESEHIHIRIREIEKTNQIQELDVFLAQKVRG